MATLVSGTLIVKSFFGKLDILPKIQVSEPKSLDSKNTQDLINLITKKDSLIRSLNSKSDKVVLSESSVIISKTIASSEIPKTTVSSSSLVQSTISRSQSSFFSQNSSGANLAQSSSSSIVSTKANSTTSAIDNSGQSVISVVTSSVSPNLITIVAR